MVDYIALAGILAIIKCQGKLSKAHASITYYKLMLRLPPLKTTILLITKWQSKSWASLLLPGINSPSSLSSFTSTAAATVTRNLLQPYSCSSQKEKTWRLVKSWKSANIWEPFRSDTSTKTSSFAFTKWKISCTTTNTAPSIRKISETNRTIKCTWSCGPLRTKARKASAGD